MSLKETVHDQVVFMGRTLGGCKLVLLDLLSNGRDIFQFMRLFTASAVEAFYREHQEEIEYLCAGDEDLLTDALTGHATTTRASACTKLALEKTLMDIEAEMKDTG